jgi:hypothetical protein
VESPVGIVVRRGVVVDRAECVEELFGDPALELFGGVAARDDDDDDDRVGLRGVSEPRLCSSRAPDVALPLIAGHADDFGGAVIMHGRPILSSLVSPES